MQKTEFLDRLRTALADLPAEELEKTLGYYAEMIEDRMEDGMDEEAAVAAMGDPEAVAVMKPMWEELGHHVLTLKAEDKIKYHAAAAMASNEMLGLMQASIDVLSECGFAEEDSMALLRPLVEGNIASMLEKGCVNALTGPVERGDVQTVEKHLQALAGSKAGRIYQSLGSTMVELAGRRNPDRDYTPIRKLFEENAD